MFCLAPVPGPHRLFRMPAQVHRRMHHPSMGRTCAQETQTSYLAICFLKQLALLIFPAPIFSALLATCLSCIYSLKACPCVVSEAHVGRWRKHWCDRAFPHQGARRTPLWFHPHSPLPSRNHQGMCAHPMGPCWLQTISRGRPGWHSRFSNSYFLSFLLLSFACRLCFCIVLF